MTYGAITPKLIAFSTPLILSSVLQLLFNAADVIVVGRFAGDRYLAAVGSTSSLINLLVNLFLGLSIGTNVVAAGYYGGKKKKEVRETVHTSMILSVASGLLLTVFGCVFAKMLLRLMSSPPDVLPLAAQYLQVYFCGTTPMMVYNFASALLRAKGDTKRPLFILMLAGVINVILNLVFVIILKMHVVGVALATAISQSVSAILVTLILVFENDDFRLSRAHLKVNRYILTRILRIGIPAGFQGIMFSISNVIIQSSINTFGSTVIAGNSAGISTEGFVYTSMNGFSQGVLTFVGQNVGAKKRERIKRVVIAAQLIVFIIGVVLGVGVTLCSQYVLSTFSKSPAVIAAGQERLRVICTFYALCGLMDCMGNAVRGLGHSSTPAIVAFLGSCALRILWLLTIFQVPQFHTCFIIFLSYPISWLVTWVSHTICFIKIYSKMDF